MNITIELNPGDRILISRTDRLGDLILAIPFVETMKLRYPECRVDVSASLYASPILENNPRIDKIVRIQNDQLQTSRPYKKDLRHNIKRSKYKVVVALYPERQVSRLFHQAGIEHRIGTAGRFHSIFYNHRLLHSRKANRKHEYEYKCLARPYTVAIMPSFDKASLIGSSISRTNSSRSSTFPSTAAAISL